MILMHFEAKLDGLAEALHQIVERTCLRVATPQSRNRGDIEPFRIPYRRSLLMMTLKSLFIIISPFQAHTKSIKINSGMQAINQSDCDVFRLDWRRIDNFSILFLALTKGFYSIQENDFGNRVYETCIKSRFRYRPFQNFFLNTILSFLQCRSSHQLERFLHFAKTFYHF